MGVHRQHHHLTLGEAVGQRAALVRADRFDRQQRAVAQPEHRDLVAVDRVGAGLAARVIPLVGLLVIATVSNTRPEIVCAIYLVLIALAALGAALFMDNLGNQRSNRGAMAEALRYKHSWVMSFLYIGTFGSFIGFSFAFGQVLQINFLAGGGNGAQASLHAAQVAFIGPLLGSISRSFGGKLSDRIGGGKVTLTRFNVMMFAAGILVVTGMIDDGMKGAATGGQMIA